MSPDDYATRRRTPGCADTVSRCVLFAILIVIAAVVTWPFWRGRHDMPIARTEAIIEGLFMALDAYRDQHTVYPPDSGTGLHADLDKPAECLVYYLSGGSVFYDPATSPRDYPWKHALLDVGDLGKGRKKALVYYSFNSKSLEDTDGDGLPEVVDPWGNPLLYNSGPKADGPFNQNGAPKHHSKRFDLSSAGPDGKHGTEADIKNWRD
ncbi:MAG: hypothetical protein ABIF82_06630 [Planctomycetota bacterium]